MATTPSDGTRGPLAGVKVLDLSAVVSGPLCTQILGDLGADVWKVEPPQGDITRMMGPPFRAGMTGIFAQVNRNKRGIVVDMKRAEGVTVARRLAARADVLVENFRPGVAERLGVGYDALAAENPGLVYVAISGFGPDGPYADLPAYDNVIQGLAGFAEVQGDDRPRLIRSIVADKASGMTATYAVMAALFARERGGGRGQRIDVPMLDSYAAFMLADVIGGETFLPKDEAAPPFDMAAVHRTWETADGHVVMMIVQDDQFHAMCRAIDREDLIADERYANLITRIVHGKELFTLVEQELLKWTTEEIVARARRFGAPLAPANGIAEFLRDPQVVASGIMEETEDPVVGRMRLLRSPARFHASPARARRRPPQLGEHTAELLAEAGYAEAEIAALKDAGAVV